MKHITRTLGVAIAVMCGISSQASVTLTDIGGSPPTPGPDDIYFLDNGDSYSQAEPAGLNYYSNGGGQGYPGQIFTTGTNLSGYQLNSVTVNIWGGAGSGGGYQSSQSYTLAIYSYNSATTNATLLATFTSQPFSVVDEHYITFTGISAALSANTKYAYTIRNNVSGWGEVAAETALTPVNEPGFASSLYNTNTGNIIDPNDQAACVPGPGGTVALPTAVGCQAWFDIGLSIITQFTVNPPVLTTAGNLYPSPAPAFTNGTAVTLASGSVFGGTPPYHYQWAVSADQGATFSNLGTDSSTLTTTPVANGYYEYRVTVSDSSINAITTPALDLTIAPANLTVSMSDEGLNNSSSVCYDSIAQLSGGGAITSINYYDNFATSPCGNIFFTGGNAGGYILNSVQLQTGNNGDTSSGTSTLQGYYLFIYKLNNAQTLATLVQEYIAPSFGFTFGDWVEWEGLSTPLDANSTYAYTFLNANNGLWAGMNASSSSVTNSSVGLACLIAPADASISTNTEGWSGVFQVGLTDVGAPPVVCPLANGILQSPLGAQNVGTSITLTENASGATPFTYAWHTDGGLGGALSISAGTTQSITINTPGSPLAPGQYQYNVTVSNGQGSPSTSATIIITILVPTESGVLSLLGTNPPVAGTYDIAQTEWFGANQKPGGLNYYWDNITPPGQTFTTGGNSTGYVLNYVDLQLAGDDGIYVSGVLPLPTNGGGFILTIYSVNLATTNAKPIAIYDSQTNFVVTTGSTDTNWIRFSGLSVPLAASSTYAYSFGKVPADPGWCCMASSIGNNPYAGGQICLIPPTGGTITYESSGQYDAVFDLGLSLGTVTLNYTVLPNGNIELCWSTGTLVYTTSLTPPITWTPVPGATSCWTVTPTGPGKFYAVRVP